jgi:hypothetical protein
VETEAILSNLPVSQTLRIWENRNLLLIEGRDYTVNYDTGKVKLLSMFYEGATLTADYRYVVPSIGPIQWSWNTADWTTIPGVVLAFGKRGKPGDKMAIVVYADRVDTAQAYGGRFDVSFDLDVIAQDPIQMEEIADTVTMTLWADKRSVLSSEGIELVDVSMGGEAEETYDETGDLYFYTASMSVQLQADWEVHIPLPFTISKVVAATRQAEASVTADRRGGASSLVAMSQGGLFFATVPVIKGRNSDYERIT